MFYSYLFPQQTKGITLSAVRTCVVVAEERPRIALTNSFSKLFRSLGLSPRAVSTSFGCRVNVAIGLQVRQKFIIIKGILSDSCVYWGRGSCKEVWIFCIHLV